MQIEAPGWNTEFVLKIKDLLIYFSNRSRGNANFC